MKFHSPLRYPGGKARFTSFLTDTIDLNDLRNCTYFEPYAGGAGAALGLLKNGVVSKVFLNDADYRVYSFWRAALEHPNKFTDRIREVSLTIDEWRHQRHICAHPKSYSLFEVGFSAFYMNRCNRSGVMLGSGPIGGFSQNGHWQIDVRFNREGLAERILRLCDLKNHIKVACCDAIEFLKHMVPKGHARSRVLVYLDPPYVCNGHRLYLNAYDRRDHKRLAKYLTVQKSMPWIMSYDDSSLIREIYGSQCIFSMPIHYSLQNKRSAMELIICPRHLSMPRACRANGRERAIDKGNSGRNGR